MPLKLEIKKQLSARSERVKSVDFHPTEPWVLAGMYSGSVAIWDYSSQTLVRQMEVSNLPIRCVKFAVRRQWIIAGCDDMSVKILNYNTLERIKSLEGHSDYIRHVAVHPSLPLLLTSSDDMSIKLWDWEKNWQCIHTFEGHSHYVMMVVWNPKENTSFASASLDRSIKIWGVSGGAHFTLTGHQRGVNCLDYAVQEKPYLVSGSDDKTVRVWDYQTKQCVHVLEGHSGNVSSVVFHPVLPVILSGSEDGICKIWHSTTYRLENSLNYMLDRLWSIAVLKNSRAVALGYDEGTVVVQLGSDVPVVSYTGGKIVWAKGSGEIQTVNLKQLDEAVVNALQDGEQIHNLPAKDMGACELFPQSITHHPSGRLFAVCGDGEYVIYTAQVLRNKSFGKAQGFAWSPEGHYATRDDGGRITVFHNFKEAFSFRTDFPVEEIYSGHLLCVKAADFLVFYDWNEYRLIRRIDVVASSVVWSENGDRVAVCCGDTLFVLLHDKDAVAAASVGGVPPEEGVDIAFNLEHEISGEAVSSGVWVSETCFVFSNDKLKLNTLVGGQVEVVAHLDHPVTVLGYMPEHARVYCVDSGLNVSSFGLQLSLVRYKSAVVAGDLVEAEKLFPEIPHSQHTKLARFLEHQGYRAEALALTTDPDHKFELAVQLGKLAVAGECIEEDDDDKIKRKILGDKALEMGDWGLAEKSFEQGQDAESLLLLASCARDPKHLLEKAAAAAKTEKKLNVQLVAKYLAGDLRGCVAVLEAAEMLGPAMLFARTYIPEMLGELFPKWKAQVAKINPQLAEALGDPKSHPELFKKGAQHKAHEPHSPKHGPQKHHEQPKPPHTTPAVATTKPTLAPPTTTFPKSAPTPATTTPPTITPATTTPLTTTTPPKPTSVPKPPSSTIPLPPVTSAGSLSPPSMPPRTTLLPPSPASLAGPPPLTTRPATAGPPPRPVGPPPSLVVTKPPRPAEDDDDDDLL